MSTVPYCPPRTSTERRVVAIWEELLGVVHIGVHDDCFSLGADSMAAVQIANRVSEEFDVEMFEDCLAGVTTVAELARRSTKS
jgi:acyl carrier protein